MAWATATYSRRWHLAHNTVGTGTIYQGRFKAIPVKDDRHFLTVCRYVERNPVRARLVSRVEDWEWSSASSVSRPSGPFLHEWPVPRPGDRAGIAAPQGRHPPRDPVWAGFLA